MNPIRDPFWFTALGGGVFFIFIAIQFINNNIIIPEPYEIELKTCLEQARQYQNQSKVDAEENKCFRTYPHFN